MSQKEDIMTKGTITRTALLAFAIINQFLTATGHNPLPADNDTASALVTAAVAILAWWKNNDFTYAAKKGTELTKSLKNGDSVQVVKASDSDHEFTEGGE